jgi:LCP family protein required for cell wall assembly
MSDWSAGPPPYGRSQPYGRPQPGGGYNYYGGRGAPAPTRRGSGPPPRPEPDYDSRFDDDYRPRRRKHWGRRVGVILVIVIALLIGFLLYLDTTLQRKDALSGLHSAPTAGTNWLLVGSDSRQDIGAAEGQQLGTGDQNDVAGGRTDTMMLMHIPASGGQPALISLPRDSYVPIPGHGKDKLNAAYAYGGAPLLAQTVESATGVHIDHYAEIGLPGFATMVDDVGGVNLCIDQPMVDPKANLNLQPGCQVLNGDQSLGYVRTRNFPNGDLQRIDDQRKLLTALVHKATSPATLFNPFKSIPLAVDAPQTFTVNNGDHIWNLFFLAMAMGDITSGKGVTAAVPFGGFGQANGGSVVLWDKNKASEMFDAIAKDQPIPPDLVQK